MTTGGDAQMVTVDLVHDSESLCSILRRTKKKRSIHFNDETADVYITEETAFRF